MRHALGWIAASLRLLVYVKLPGNDETPTLEALGSAADEEADQTKLRIVDAVPHEAVGGGAVAVRYLGATKLGTPRVWLAKLSLPILAARPGTLVVALPTELAPGRVRLRLTSGSERSRAYELKIKIGDWRKPFRNLVTTEPHRGVLGVAIGGCALCFASARSARALAWLILSAGLVAFAVQLLRPGFEPFFSSPELLTALDRAAPHGLIGAVSRVLLGALLAAAFQGPAPVMVLALTVAQLTGHEDPRSTLLLLSGSGLGSAVAALSTAPGDPRCRRLAELNLLVGLCSTLLTAALVNVSDMVAGRLLSHAWPIHWGTHRLPQSSWRVAVAFVISQLVASVTLLPCLSYAQRALAHLVRVPTFAAGEALLSPRQWRAATAAQARALPQLLRLALHGDRAAGSAAESYLRQAQELLRAPFVFRAAPATAAQSSESARLSLGYLQLQRAPEDVLCHAQQLTDDRMVWSAASPRVPPLPEHAAHVLCELDGLIASGLAALAASFHSGARLDSHDTHAREILINALELELRQDLARGDIEPRDLGVMGLVDALETAGNQLFRLAETCQTLDEHMTAGEPGLPVLPMAAAGRD
jgi:hypothetical protein